jgi:hypothetical protein
MARLLVCNTHKTVDRLPDYDTAMDMEGTHDRHLQDAIAAHFQQYGPDPGRHASLIIRIEDEELDLIDPRGLKDAIHDGTLEDYLKGEREMYKEDALGCYNLHNRPVVGFPGCPDYRSDKKAIGKIKGVPPDQRTYLCDFCPYQSYVEHAKNKEKGYYK